MESTTSMSTPPEQVDSLIQVHFVVVSVVDGD